MTTPAPSLAAVVVTYNRLPQLEVTLTRLLAEPCAHIIVVDNGSTDGSRAYLAKQRDPRLHILLPEENLGGAGGFETGMREAVAKFDPDWIVVMDDDARPEIGALKTFLANPPDTDALAAAVYYPDGRICDMNRPSLNPFGNLKIFTKTLLGGGRMGFHIPDTAYGGTGQIIDASSFVGLFLSREAIARGGYPDGDLFIYGDDAIYTLELSKAGMQIRFAPEIRFEHDCSTFQEGARIYKPLWKVYYNYRNGLILYHKAAGPLFWLVLFIVLPKWALNGRRYGADRREYYRLLWQAIKDGIRGRRGRL